MKFKYLSIQISLWFPFQAITNMIDHRTWLDKDIDEKKADINQDNLNILIWPFSDCLDLRIFLIEQLIKSSFWTKKIAKEYQYVYNAAWIKAHN